MKTSSKTRIDHAIDSFARRVTTRLNEGLAALPYDVVERLRASRMQAVAQRKRSRAVAAHPASVWSRAGSTLTLGGGSGTSGWWMTLVSGVPVLALVAGIMLMATAQDENGANEIAEVDAALLTDSLPPAAYADPGFAQFLRTGADERH